MALRLPEAPDSALSIVLETLHAFGQTSRFATPNLAQSRVGDLSLSLPHPIYTLGLSDLAEGRSVRSASLVGWRYLVQLGDRVIASAEVLVDSETQAAQFSQFNEGPYVGSTADSLGRLEEHPDLQDRTRELRLLQVPGVFTAALWLTADTEDASLISVLAPAPPELDVTRLYSEQEFAGALVERAQRNIEFHANRR